MGVELGNFACDRGGDFWPHFWFMLTILLYYTTLSGRAALLLLCTIVKPKPQKTNKQTNKRSLGTRLANGDEPSIQSLSNTYVHLTREYDHTLTVLLAMMTIGIVSSSSCSRTILARSCLRLYQLERELIANIARKPSPFEREVSRNSINSSCPAVSMISTSCRSKPYSIWVI